MGRVNRQQLPCYRSMVAVVLKWLERRMKLSPKLPTPRDFVRVDLACRRGFVDSDPVPRKEIHT